MDLKDKVILVTGGTAGIGKACTLAYVQAGALVAVMGLEQEYLKDTIDEIGADHLGICGDVSREEDVVSAIDKVIAKFGKLDAIHNNAGIASPAKPLHSTTDQEWDKLINVNLKGILLTTRHGYTHLQASKGCILNTSSLVGNIGQENHAAYSATKGAVNALTKSMAIDYAKDGIRVNSVLPAAVMTPMLKVWAWEQPEPEQVFEFLEDIHLLGYCPEGDVIADACVFLLSDKARFITGVNLPVSGGAELGYRRNV
ncbi:NAD(P)-dependent dehydrogenase, short-chain alcohol dehydrogenase family [Sphingobacterium nematocida]|uniref:NAD(P)-dependent dehydrogenase, short-chain alcohol dehydrogenase family n=1 Tax=Sphingobacterium nematocida TaxID=1513896 RepID=A0A1T5BMZ8_9SPHI|nr:SDR family oxidoreductase [Sphingobacterium nematocida]SKB48642.1 NAD(P)-dependent dehydrogenase, short-chain alcohol dehydrogenase family [Sphingobacterium nematocida]